MIDICRTISLVLYDCEICVLLWGKNVNCKCLKNKVLGKIFRPKKDEVNGRFEIVHNEKYCGLYRSHSVKIVTWEGTVGRTWSWDTKHKKYVQKFV